MALSGVGRRLFASGSIQFVVLVLVFENRQSFPHVVRHCAEALRHRVLILPVVAPQHQRDDDEQQDQ